jgi:hypothetical protein
MATGYKQSIALRQGWLVAFNVDNNILEIQRYDNATEFDSDEAAVEFVKTRAAQGDELAMAALELCGPSHANR